MLGFNSSRYDIPLIKSGLLKILNEQKCKDKSKYQGINFVIKSYSSVTTSHFKFLDISSYLTAETSYACF